MKVILIIFLFVSGFAFGQKNNYVYKMELIKITEVKGSMDINLPEFRTEILYSPLKILICGVDQPASSVNDRRDYNTGAKQTLTRDEIEKMPKGSDFLDTIW